MRESIRFDLKNLLLGMAVTGMALALWTELGVFWCLTGLTVLAVVTARQPRFRLLRVVSPLLWLGLVCYVVYAAQDVLRQGPYVVRYNNECLRIAIEIKLVGKPEVEVTRLLGEPTSVFSSWNMVNTETGLPAKGAVFVTSYNYAPYSLVPGAQFQVHCRDGKVRSLEQFDD